MLATFFYVKYRKSIAEISNFEITINKGTVSNT